jgi:hypothetical protein
VIGLNHRTGRARGAVERENSRKPKKKRQKQKTQKKTVKNPKSKKKTQSMRVVSRIAVLGIASIILLPYACLTQRAGRLAALQP